MINITETHRLIYFDYTPIADNAIKNFKQAGTCRIFKGKVFVLDISAAFFVQLLMREKTQIKLTYKFTKRLRQI